MKKRMKLVLNINVKDSRFHGNDDMLNIILFHCQHSTFDLLTYKKLPT